ncbi:MAG TPA: hypothetical protein VL966_17745 [Alphaproteobacteria bacterium]|nr:hypothetical protein [Alphaproteobacteria bacterium]
MNTRALAALAALSALAACSTGGTATTATNVAALHTNDAVVSDAAPAVARTNTNAYADGAMGSDYDPESHRFQGGWWKDH